MEDLMISIENVSKEYQLGTIGGVTLREELQRKKAKLLHREDPTTIIGQEKVNTRGKFMALSSINLQAKRGEAVGIIGQNGAGKSTLLKLITRITAPTTGVIRLNGNVTSMLEVGTGFHPELTGRENIYINGAILGMKKKEIDKKLGEIIEFSECRQFIDTPVKRYSSGMYVKLAFSVAANLDSEIMIMDEVLAVGDVAFQNKCIGKMAEVAQSGRTILYVSHNMSTIRRLCSRCICLGSGKVIYDGEVEEAINFYTKNKLDVFGSSVDLASMKRHGKVTGKIIFQRLEALNYNGHVDTGNCINSILCWNAVEMISDMYLRIYIRSIDYQTIGISNSETFKSMHGRSEACLRLPTDQLMPGKYVFSLMAVSADDMGVEIRHDCIGEAWGFEVLQSPEDRRFHSWNASWGNVMLEPIEIVNFKNERSKHVESENVLLPDVAIG